MKTIPVDIVTTTAGNGFWSSSCKTVRINKLEVDCSLLYDFETSQINIFHVKSKGNEKSFKLDYPSKAFNMTF
jgi:hypothetical protein